MEPETTLYLKNLSFSSTEQNIRQVCVTSHCNRILVYQLLVPVICNQFELFYFFCQHFGRYGTLAKVTIATKPNPKVPGERLSQGFGFIQFYKKSSADNALKNLQNSDLDGHKIEIKRSHRTLK